MIEMTDHDFLLHPEHWQHRMQKTLERADNVGAKARERLLKVAQEYERMAARAAELRAAREVLNERRY
jgi:hypothetical protein